MKKTELFEQYFVQSRLHDHIWDSWFEWKIAQAGIKRRDHNEEFDEWKDRGQYYEVLHSMPKFFNWRPKADGTVTFYWEGGNEVVPAEAFISDLDQQPDLEMLWHCSYYDGPLNGIAKYNGETVWFELVDFDEGNWMYDLYRLSDEQIKKAAEVHEMFRNMVGTDSDHHPDLPAPTQVATDESCSLFFEQFKTYERPSYTESDKIGTFPYHQFNFYIHPTN